MHSRKVTELAARRRPRPTPAPALALRRGGPMWINGRELVGASARFAHLRGASG